MSEIRTILERLAHLEEEVSRLKSVKSNDFDSLPPDATVGKDYVAWRFGCSESAVVRGRFGTARIPRISQKPLKFIKKQVDAAFREKIKPVSEKAAEERAKARPIRRSIIKIQKP